MNISDANSPLLGVSNGVLYGQNERVDELNDRIQTRHFPDKALAPNFSPRPTMTKYSHFPMLDNRTSNKVPIHTNYDYSMITNFSPPVMMNGQVNGFINNVDTETILRNQTVALNRGADQGVYVPSSNSDLYKVHVPSRPSDQPHLLLFEKPVFENAIHPNIAAIPRIGVDQFNNNTRTQLRNTIIN